MKFGTKWLAGALCAGLLGCKDAARAPVTKPIDARPLLQKPAAPWEGARVPGPGETVAFDGRGARIMSVADAKAAGLLNVDLSDTWVPFIFSEDDGPGTTHTPNTYRQSFLDLANDQKDENDLYLAGGATRPIDLSPEAVEKRRKEAEAARRGKKPAPPPRRKRTEPVQNFLEVFGIPPTLTVLLRRIEDDAARTCYAAVDRAALQAFTGTVLFLSHQQARRDFEQAQADDVWMKARIAAGGPDAGTDPKLSVRAERWRLGQVRVRAVRAAQDRLVCEGLLSPRLRFTPGSLDLPTHQALSQWERKNDIFGWGFLGDETLAALLRPPADLHLDTFRRVLTERMADAASIIEDGSVSSGRKPATYKTLDGQVVPVPNLLGDHVGALLRALGVTSSEDMGRFLRKFAPDGLRGLHVAFAPPPRPPYYGTGATAEMELEAEIDRGDVWYEFPFDAQGDPVVQRRDRFPALTLFVRWEKQRIPLARWRTTIGSWRSEMHTDGKVYFKYKQSDVGPRIWRDIVAAPVWVPPDGTPAKDLLTKKVFDRSQPPVSVVNTEIMGPGYQSAYGLVLGIHHQKTRGGGVFDNQIRTHGSVDYTSIARRFSHGCHRLVNSRAVRLFGFVLRHRPFVRKGQSPLHMKKFFVVDGVRYGYEMTTRGYYYELVKPVPVETLEGRLMGALKKPVLTVVRKPGVDYGPDEADAVNEAVVPPEGVIDAKPPIGP